MYRVQDRGPDSVLAAVRAGAPGLAAFIDEQLNERGLSERDAALVGFSQGTMMALHVGLRRERPFAGIIGYSGRLIAPRLIAEEMRSRPPVPLVHGADDSRAVIGDDGSGGAAGGRGSGRDVGLRRHRGTRSTKKVWCAAGFSCTKC